MSRLGNSVVNYVYNADNQLVSILEHDDQNRLVKKTRYTYDPMGRRVGKRTVDLSSRVQSSGASTASEQDKHKTFSRSYVYNAEDILLEYGSAGVDVASHWDAQSNMIPTPALLARYTHSGLGADDVLGVEVTAAGVDAAVAQSPGYFEYLKDAQGTITDITDSNGNKIQHFIYSGFGKLLGVQTAAAAGVEAAELYWPAVAGIKADGSPGISQSSDPGDLAARENLAKPALFTPYTYTGREFDSESGNYYYRARYYDPNIGRFLQRDLHPGKLSTPLSVNNSFIYTMNNPINRVDPKGDFGFSTVFAKVGKGLSKFAGHVVAGVSAASSAVGNLAKRVGVASWKKIGVVVASVGIAVLAVATGGAAVAAVGAWMATLAGGGAIGAVAGFVAGAATSALIGGAASFTTSVVNQAILNGVGNIDFGRAAKSFVAGAVASTLGFGAGQLVRGVGVIGGYKRIQDLGSAIADATVSGSISSCADDGIIDASDYSISRNQDCATIRLDLEY